MLNAVVSAANASRVVFVTRVFDTSVVFRVVRFVSASCMAETSGNPLQSANLRFDISLNTSKPDSVFKAA